MKTSMKKALAALCAATAVPAAFAAAGYTHPAEGFVSTRTRAEVKEELRRAHAEHTDGISMRDGADASAGAQGVAGSRYSMRTREEVKAELAASKSKDPAAFQKSLYFGD